MTASTATDPAAEPHPGATPPVLEPRWASRRVWVVAVVLAVTVAAALVPLLFNHRFYYYDDTQTGAAGVWYQFGNALLSGDLRYLDLTTWGSGNLIVEGQWGILNPVMWGLSIGAALASDLGVYMTVVKIGLLSWAALGSVALVRTSGAAWPVAALCGILAPLNGFTVYMDSPSWVTGLFAWAWFPWFWWALVRLVEGRGGLLLPALFAYIIASNGYVHGALLVLMLLGAYALVRLYHRRWRQVLQLTVLGCFVVATCVAVYLPSVLTAPVTRRSAAGIVNSGFLGPDVSDLLTATALAPGVEINSWIGTVITVPLFYLAWLLPVLLLGVSQRIRASAQTGAIVVFLVILGAFMLGPTDVGPLRFPVRVFPYVALAVLFLVSQRKPAVAVDQGGPLPRHWKAILVGLPVVGAWLTFADLPQGWRHQLAGLVLVLGGLFAVVVIERRPTTRAFAALGAIGITLVLTVAQRWSAPASPLPDFGLPGALATIQAPLDGVEGQTFAIGNLVGSPGDDLWSETSMAKAWQVNPRPVQNSYVVIGYRAYNDLLQMNYLGLTEAATLDILLEKDPATDLSLADELGIQNLQLWRHSFPDRDLASPAEGWRVTGTGQYTVVWTRTRPAIPLGTPVFASAGTSFDVTANSDDRIALRISNSTSSEGTVILSRLAWPGYSVRGPAQLTDPHRGFLLTLRVPPGAADAEVSVAFAPPGFVAGLVVLLGAAVLLLVVELLGRARRRGRGRDSA